ncbi:hypothetical protein AMJ57_00265 [Parcubacteria bacterium SG8_24]|nr:MAG: hypothetical protein AMJ57_00265 [Parcubacteria bacterium SG8_24]
MRYRIGDPYTPLIEELERARQWAMVQLLENQGAGERLDAVRRLFLTATERRDDEQAETCFRWLLKAVDDFHLGDFLGETMRGKVLDRTDGLDEAREQLVRCRAAEAVDLWSKLPSKGVGKCRVQVAEDESYLEDCDAPTLLKTKKAVLEEVARRWRDTKDEDEADRLFGFIVQIDSRFEEERKLVETVVREATGPGFPTGRAVRCYLSLADRMERFGCRLIDRIARTLAISWARNSDSNDLLQVFGAVRPLLKEKKDPTYPEFACLRETADRLADLEAKVEVLRAALYPPDSFWKKWHVLFRFPAVDRVEVVETLQSGHGTRDENGLHDRFGILRDLVQEWHDRYPEIEVLVRLEVPHSFKEGEFTFEREQRLDR